MVMLAVCCWRVAVRRSERGQSPHIEAPQGQRMSLQVEQRRCVTELELIRDQPDEAVGECPLCGGLLDVHDGVAYCTGPHGTDETKGCGFGDFVE